MAPGRHRLTLLVVVTYFLTCAVRPVDGGGPPNVLFVLLDDLGYSDVGFRDGRFNTPTIDDLYAKGVRFNASYTPPNCGPSRAALLSGMYPYRMGLQGNAINSRSSAAIPYKREILPRKFQELGYQTHLVGKWHQGFCKRTQLPTRRGFDSFYGFYLTKQDHFSHEGKKMAYDFRFNEAVDRSVEGKYSTHIYTERVRSLIKDYKESLDADPENTKPFFILLSHAAPHGPNQVPAEYISGSCLDIDDTERQKKCGMMAAVDEGLGQIMDDLRNYKLAKDVLVVFTSDDGGKPDDGSSNWPLRGGKRSLWEGGIRVNTFLYSESPTILPKTDFTWDGLFFITDFYATLWGFATKNATKKISGVSDSYNHWKLLKAGLPTKSYRRVFSYVDQNLGVAMLRHRNWKLLHHQSRYPGWYNPPPGANPLKEPNRKDLPDYQLFNIRSDPSERSEVRHQFPEILDRLTRKLDKIRKRAKPPIHEKLDSSPSRFGNVWSSGWCERE